jgi:F420-non-reducing hydrogenase iron-sulfur subunit
MRAQYPANIRIIKVPCTGKVNELHILKSLESGADGVYLVGCEEGNCHFMAGNLRARKRLERVQRILDSIGIESDRIAMYNLSAGEGMKFVEYAMEMTERIRGLGPSPIKPKEQEIKDSSFQEIT